MRLFGACGPHENSAYILLFKGVEDVDAVTFLATSLLVFVTLNVSFNIHFKSDYIKCKIYIAACPPSNPHAHIYPQGINSETPQ